VRNISVREFNRQCSIVHTARAELPNDFVFTGRASLIPKNMTVLDFYTSNRNKFLKERGILSKRFETVEVEPDNQTDGWIKALRKEVKKEKKIKEKRCRTLDWKVSKLRVIPRIWTVMTKKESCRS